jgi:hypothetical protein
VKVVQKGKYKLDEFKREFTTINNLLDLFNENGVSGVFSIDKFTIHITFGNPVHSVIEFLVAADGRIGVVRYDKCKS